MLTPEDLQQIRAIVQEQTRAIVQEETRAIVEPIVERSMEAMTANLSDLRAELLIRFQATDRTMDRMSESLRGIQTQLMGLNRWADTLDRDNNALAANYHAHDRAIRDLTTRVAALEEKRQ
jgi:hypothetical protein